MWKLTIEDDEGQQTTLDLSMDEYAIGRAEDASVRLTERNISRRHAHLRATADGWTLEDVGSYNGTYLNGERLGGPMALVVGSIVQLGDYRIELIDAAVAEVPDEPVVRERRPDRLVVVIGPVPGAEFSLEGDCLTIGRADEAHVSINHSSVSRIHAELHALDENRWEVIDHGSSNGVRINGVELRRGIIEPGDALELGDVRLRFVAAGKYFRPGTELSQQLPAVVPFEGASSSAQAAGETKRSFGTIAAVALVVGAAIVVFFLMVGGGSGSNTDPEPASSAAPMATSEAEAKAILEGAVEIGESDVIRAHNQLKRIPDNSPLQDTDEFRSIEERWADAIFEKVDATDDVKEKRRLLNEISDTTTVSAEKRKQAAEAVLALGPPEEDRPVRRPPTSSGGGPVPPRATGPVPSATASAAPSATTPAKPPKGDERFDEKAQKRALYGKAVAGRASEGELRMLKAICMNDGDRACRNMAVQRLKELRDK
jgi:pSer/pThr/pTyr-binding forkhead associated (FHA) protein